MRRAGVALAVLIVVFLLLALPASAEESAISKMEELLPSEIREEALTSRLGVEATVEALLSLLQAEIPTAVRFFLLLLGVSVLSALAAAPAPMHPELSRALRACVSTVLAVAVWSFLYPLVLDALATVEELSELCKGALPVFVSVHLSVGAGQSALADAAGLGGVISLLELALSLVILPLFSLYLCVSLIGGGTDAVGRLSERLYRLLLSLIGIFSVLVSGTLALQSALATAKDSLLLRTVRHATGTMIPVVGSTVSGALSTLLAGGAYVKQTVGTLAMLGILSICVPILCRLLLCRLALGVLELLPSPLCDGGGVLLTVRRALELLVGIVAMAVLLFLLCTVLFLKSGGGDV